MRVVAPAPLAAGLQKLLWVVADGVVMLHAYSC
jgi:hypothetical protein